MKYDYELEIDKLRRQLADVTRERDALYYGLRKLHDTVGSLSVIQLERAGTGELGGNIAIAVRECSAILGEISKRIAALSPQPEGTRP